MQAEGNERDKERKAKYEIGCGWGLARYFGRTLGFGVAPLPWTRLPGLGASLAGRKLQWQCHQDIEADYFISIYTLHLRQIYQSNALLERSSHTLNPPSWMPLALI